MREIDPGFGVSSVAPASKDVLHKPGETIVPAGVSSMHKPVEPIAPAGKDVLALARVNCALMPGPKDHKPTSDWEMGDPGPIYPYAPNWPLGGELGADPYESKPDSIGPFGPDVMHGGDQLVQRWPIKGDGGSVI